MQTLTDFVTNLSVGEHAMLTPLMTLAPLPENDPLVACIPHAYLQRCIDHGLLCRFTLAVEDPQWPFDPAVPFLTASIDGLTAWKRWQRPDTF